MMLSSSIPIAGMLAILAHLFSSTTLGFSVSPLQKQLAKIESLNRADTNGGAPGSGGGDDGDDSPELLGDLITTPFAELTPTGKAIRELLLNTGNPESDVNMDTVPPLESPECASDTCCVWRYVADKMAEKFRGESGRCTRWARMAVRLGFHDAGTWSKSAASNPGGADGSICLSDEFMESENSGLEDMCLQMREWYESWTSQGFSITMADMIQMGANVGAVVCPLGPRTRSFVGRRDWDGDTPNNSSRLPSAFAPADDLIRLFRDKTIGPHQLVALVGAHTTSQQSTVNVSLVGAPQDSTPGIWDILFYGETTGSIAAPPRVFKFPSDVALSSHPTTSDEWRSFTDSGGQEHWNRDYAMAYIRLSLLGVNDINNLTECTKVLPDAVREFSNPDQVQMNMWLGSSANTAQASEIAEVVEAGDSIS